jgi:hypothetical protein
MPCLVCNSHRLTPRLDLGAHPVSSFFLRERNAPETAYNVTLGDCADCGTIQAMQPVPHHALVPPYDWLFAREPEEHLDATVENIVALPGVTTDCVVGALTYKDDTTVDRFRRKGFQNTWRVSVRDDLGVDNPAANIETVQKLTTADRMAAIAAKHGAADILIVRHILEHAEDVQGFLAGLAAMVKPGGIIMVEVPDCTTSLKLNDYCMVWEEHSLYLTPKTFLGLLARAGFEPIRTDIYPLPFENSLVQLARRGTPQAAPLTPAEVAAELTLLPAYAEAFPAKTAGLRAALTKLRAEKGPIALFGAGHLACHFVNFHGLADLIDFVADDTPQKQNLYLPGARLLILPSGEMVARGVKTCLFALSINNENNVVARNQAFLDQGGTFYSIFAASPRSVHALIG